MSVRTYLYVSDAKVDMYLQQLDQVEKERLAAQVKISLGVVSASLDAEKTVAGNRMSRLRAVETLLRREKSIGDSGSTASWIEGVGPFAQATFQGDRGVALYYFSSDELFLGLVGSMHHVIGNVRGPTAEASASYLTSLLMTTAIIDGAQAGVIEKSDEDLDHYVKAGIRSVGRSAWLPLTYTLARQYDQAATQRIDFLARRLSTEIDPNGRRVTIATPLYVAAVD
jgi:hypothetical protein